MKKLKIILVKVVNVYLKLFPVLFHVLDFSLLQKDWSIYGISAATIAMFLFLIAQLINVLGIGHTPQKECCVMNDQRDFVDICVVVVLLILSTCILILI